MKKFFALLFLSLSLNSVIFAQEPTKTDIEKPSDKTENRVENKVDPIKQAKDLMLLARKAKSEKSLAEIKDIKITSEVTLIFPQDKFQLINETTVKFPDKTLTVISGPFGEIKNSYNGTIAWATTPGGTQEIVGDNALEFENALAGDPISILRNFDQENYKVEFLGEGSFEGQTTNNIKFTTNKGHEINLYLDSKTNMIVGRAFQSKAAGVTYMNEEIYSNFQKFDAVEIPMKRIFKRNSQLFAEVEVKEVKINSGVDDKIFVKPQ
ncbi:MAG: hypothetical protein HY819_01265 [Acidobacteria bacterium]|nr:hypothetical protein [Acidobacteriota bacterium]